MRKRTLLCIVSLLTAGTLFAQSIEQPVSKHARINLSLWKNVATQHTDTIGRTALNIGIFSSMNQLHGLGINLLSTVTQRDVKGIELAGLANLTGKSMQGIQLAGITNISGASLRGLSAAGLVNIAGQDARGIVAGGLATICGNGSRGVTIGGLLNIGADNVQGAQLSGLTNICGESMHGLSIAGLLNVTGKDLTGLQLSALANIAGEQANGLQLSALGNVAGKQLNGLQLGTANIAYQVKGLQIGVFNYYKKSLDGLQLGLINANPDTRYQLMLFGGNAAKANVALRVKNNRCYTILGMGTGYRDIGDKFSATFFYRAGMEWALGHRFDLGGDLGYQHIESLKNKHHGYPSRLYSLQARLNASCRLTEQVALFLSGGYGGSRFYNKNITYEKGVIAEAGIILF